MTSEFSQTGEEKPAFPGLASKLPRLADLASTKLGKSKIGTPYLLGEAKEIALKGTVTADLFLDGAKKSRLFRVRLSEEEASHYFRAAEHYLTDPSPGLDFAHYENFIDSKLEELMSGNGPRGRYEEVTVSPAK